MSTNKFKYWEVNTTKVIRALNKTDAIKAANRVSSVPRTKVMQETSTVERIPAASAHMSASN